MIQQCGYWPAVRVIFLPVSYTIGVDTKCGDALPQLVAVGFFDTCVYEVLISWLVYYNDLTLKCLYLAFFVFMVLALLFPQRA